MLKLNVLLCLALFAGCGETLLTVPVIQPDSGGEAASKTPVRRSESDVPVTTSMPAESVTNAHWNRTTEAGVASEAHEVQEADALPATLEVEPLDVAPEPRESQLPLWPETLDAVEDICLQGTEQIHEATVTFRSPEQSCRWRKLGNLEPAAGRVRARNSKEMNLDLPDNAVICSLSLVSLNKRISYDDALVVALDDRVIMSSQGQWISPTDEEADEFDGSPGLRQVFASDDFGLPVWDWESLKDAALQPHPRPFCLKGNDERDRCRLPKSGARSSAYLRLTGETAHKFNLVRRLGSPHRLTVVSTGDADGGDCQHGGLVFEVRIDYRFADRADVDLASLP